MDPPIYCVSHMRHPKEIGRERLNAFLTHFVMGKQTGIPGKVTRPSYRNIRAKKVPLRSTQTKDEILTSRLSYFVLSERRYLRINFSTRPSVSINLRWPV